MSISRGRKLNFAQIEFARHCYAQRSRYPTRGQLARMWGVTEKNLRQAEQGFTYKEISQPPSADQAAVPPCSAPGVLTGGFL